jgi:hypothetical protein
LHLRIALIVAGKEKRQPRERNERRTEGANVTTSGEEIVLTNQGVSTVLPQEEVVLVVEQPHLQEKVNHIIHEWLTDLWLLLTGEELDEGFTSGSERDGRAFAMVCNGELHLLGSRVSALNALRSVGIEMS